MEATLAVLFAQAEAKKRKKALEWKMREFLMEANSTREITPNNDDVYIVIEGDSDVMVSSNTGVYNQPNAPEYQHVHSGQITLKNVATSTKKMRFLQAMFLKTEQTA